MTGDRLACALTLLVGLLVPSEGFMARHPDYARATIVLPGPVAREIAIVLGVQTGKASAIELALPASMEHFQRMAERLPPPPRAGTPSERSASLRAVASWEPALATLRLGEHWFDRRTGIPRSEGPAYYFCSPSFEEGSLGPAAGWEPLLRTLLALPAERSETKRLRHKRYVLGDQLHVVLSLWEEPMGQGRRRLMIEAGPPVAASPDRGDTR